LACRGGPPRSRCVSVFGAAYKVEAVAAIVLALVSQQFAAAETALALCLLVLATAKVFEPLATDVPRGSVVRDPASAIFLRSSPVDVRRIDAASTRDLRERVLWPGRPDK